MAAAVAQVLVKSIEDLGWKQNTSQNKKYTTLVSSWAFARLSTAMAKNTLRRVSNCLWFKNKFRLTITKSIVTFKSLPENNSYCTFLPCLWATTEGWISVKQQDTVSKESENNEVNGREHSAMNTPLWFNPMVHDSVPVFPSEDLQKQKLGLKYSIAKQWQKKQQQHKIDFHLEDGENGCRESVKISCWGLVFKIEPAGPQYRVFRRNPHSLPRPLKNDAAHAPHH